MKANVYGEALYEAIVAGTSPQEAFERLRDVLKRHGRSSLYKATLVDAHARFAKDAARTVVRVTVAREHDAKTYQKDIAAFLKEIGGNETVVTVDETLIGGYIATSVTRQRDASYRRSLLTIYKSLTA